MSRWNVRAVGVLAFAACIGVVSAEQSAPSPVAPLREVEAPSVPAPAPRGEGPFLPCADTLYVSTGNTHANGGGRIYRVDPESADVTLVVVTGLDRLGAIEFDALGRILCVSGGSAGPGTLFAFDLVGSAEEIGPITGVQGVDGIRFDGDGDLWGSAFNGAGGALVTINPATGAVLTNVALFGDTGNNFCAGLAFDPGGRLFLSRGNAAGRTCDLAENTPLGTGQIVPIGPATEVISDIWVNSVGTMYGCSPTGLIYLIDQETGDKTALVGTGLTLSGMTGVDGCCPAPVAPFGPGPAHGATGVDFNGVTLSWNNPPGAPGPAPLGGGASPRSALAFDNGSSNLLGVSEATIERVAEDFSLGAASTTIDAVRFWMAEDSLGPGWDGVCEYQVCADAGGEPGAVLDSAFVTATRVWTGRDFSVSLEPNHLEYECLFDLPAPLTLGPGTYWLTLHLSADCLTFDDVHWASAAGGGLYALTRHVCMGAWNATVVEHAFQLLGPDDGCCRVLYGAATGTAGSGNGPSNLYRIDPATGAWELVGPIGFNGVTGLSFHPVTGVLYGTCIDPDYTNEAALITIDPDTGTGTHVGIVILPVGLQFRVPDISFRSDGTLFGYGDGPDQLIVINPASANAFVVGATGFTGGGNGMDFAPSGRLYATPFDTNCLVELDPSTGAGVCITPGGVVPNRVSALEFCPDTGVLYGAFNDFNTFYYIVTLDPVTGDATSFVETIDGLDAIAFRCPRNVCDVEYDVFLGTSPNGGDPVCEGVTEPSCGPIGGLLPDTTYYWQVLCRGPGGEVLGPNWSFSTDGDCQTNGVADSVDVTSGASRDCNGNLVPDECEYCLGDLNGDGLRDTADLGLLLSVFLTGNCVADFNNDGVVDTADLGLLLGVFGIPCPF